MRETGLEGVEATRSNLKVGPGREVGPREASARKGRSNLSNLSNLYASRVHVITPARG